MRNYILAGAVLLAAAWLFSPTVQAAPPMKLMYQAFNVSAPGANTAILGGKTIKTSGPVALRITIALTTSSVVNLTATDGSTTHKWGLNSSTALNAADLYSFEVPVMEGLTYDVEVETDSVIETLVIHEVQY